MINRRNLLLGAVATGAVMTRGFSFATVAEDNIVLTAEETQLSFAPGQLPSSPFWFYNGQSPGPTIRVRQGDVLRVRFVNKLSEPSSIHWHGIRIANEMDGVAGLTQDAVLPGDEFEYEFAVPDAGTFWYHAHNQSWNQVARGLYGTLIVDEPKPIFDKDHDLTLVIDDWRINREGALDLASLGALMDWSHGGRLGNLITVNGTFRPKFSLNAGEAYRIRLINASNARIFEFDPSRFDAKILAYDGQAFPELIKLPYSPMLVGPAQRVDLLVTPIAGGNFEIGDISTNKEIPIADFDVVGDTPKPADAPILVPNNILEPDLEKAAVYRLEMTGGAMGRIVETTYKGKVLKDRDFPNTKQVWAFNGVANLAEEPFMSLKRGQSVVIEVVNDTAFPHAMHVHGHHFRIIEREGSNVDEGKPWRDTFLVGAEQTTRIAFTADNPGKWLFHCHMLEHAAAGMNTWFEVL